MAITPVPKSRPYVVTDKASGTQRLVQASNATQAMRHAAHGTFSVAAATPNDVIALMAAGVKPETAGDEAAPQSD
jgi:hypothetical protein